MPNLAEKKAEWNEVAAKIFEEVEAWHKIHPEATFVEIETAIDHNLARLRNQMLKDSSQTSAAQGLENRLKCESCGVKLHRRGKQKRRILSERGQSLELERDYLVCPKCGVGLFPPG